MTKRLNETQKLSRKREREREASALKKATETQDIQLTGRQIALTILALREAEKHWEGIKIFSRLANCTEIRADLEARISGRVWEFLS